MPVVLQVENLTKSFGADFLFQDISFVLNEGDKVGLIAKNGTGKTTLLNIINGTEGYDSGNILWHGDFNIGYLPQMPSLQGSATVIDSCLTGNDSQSQAVRQYEAALAGGTADEVAAASLAMDNAHAWDYEYRFKQILTQLKITDFNQPVSQLSGGQVKRVALAKILLNEPQVLILDEPTNHLDIDMIEWLENYLSKSRTTLLMVTHDRYFLDKICNRIMEIHQQKAFFYDGNYNYYLEKRAERISAQNAQTERARNLLRTELEWMRRQPQARAHKAQYRIDAFYDLRERAQGFREEKNVTLNVNSTYIGNKIFTAHHVSKRFEQNVILDDFNYIFARYEKLGIVGDNGVGKTTFIRLLLGELQPDSGRFEVGETVRWGYYSQEGIALEPTKRVIDVARDVAEEIWFDEKTHYSVSQFLNLFLFSVADQQKFIGKLSGGEKRRLYLALVLMRKPNFLILDEPTNDLDITTLEILEDYLQRFKGCLIVVSHDRFFMDRTVDHIFVFQGNGVIKDFPGNYSEFRAWQEHHRLEQGKPVPEQKQKPQRTAVHTSAPRLSYKEQKELEALTGELEKLNQEKQSLDADFESGMTDDIETKAQRYEELKSLIDEKELRWLELTEKSE
ncbi:MAG: ABC-F family ATP-binding cassette domain-containing protein [Muribaculaceae bacterium]|nr:ABC-F family ATP-binding cassette domain-containing protein [Muribaculaceae bacterium]